MTLCLWTSELRPQPPPPLSLISTPQRSYHPTCQDLNADNFSLFRYQIEDNEDAWKEAEKQVLNASKAGKSNPVVSVKGSKQKRKAAGGQTAEEVYNEAFGEKKHKKHKKSKK